MAPPMKRARTWNFGTALTSSQTEPLDLDSDGELSIEAQLSQFMRDDLQVKKEQVEAEGMKVENDKEQTDVLKTEDGNKVENDKEQTDEVKTKDGNKVENEGMGANMGSAPMSPETEAMYLMHG
eukprot:6468380-Amphidinium_carterae.1